MKTIKLKYGAVILSWVITFLLIPSISTSQDFSLNQVESSIKIYGTSNLHDWHIDVEEVSGNISFKDLESAELLKCNLEIVAESLKSGKKGMDKNTYKALNTDTYKLIVFELVKIKELTKNEDGKFMVIASGDLKIKDITKHITIQFSLEVSDDSITLSGEKTIKMTDFNVPPPKALFGTITTGDEITVKFNATFN